MRKQKIIKVSELKSLNTYLNQGWSFGFMLPDNKHVVIEKYTQSTNAQQGEYPQQVRSF